MPHSFRFHFKCPSRTTRLISSLRKNLCGCNRWRFHLLSSGIGEWQYDPLWCTEGPEIHLIAFELGLLFCGRSCSGWLLTGRKKTRVSRLISDGKEWEAAAPSLVLTGDLTSSSLKENTKAPIELLPVWSDTFSSRTQEVHILTEH